MPSAAQRQQLLMQRRTQAQQQLALRSGAHQCRAQQHCPHGQPQRAGACQAPRCARIWLAGSRVVLAHCSKCGAGGFSGRCNRHQPAPLTKSRAVVQHTSASARFACNTTRQRLAHGRALHHSARLGAPERLLMCRSSSSGTWLLCASSAPSVSKLLGLDTKRLPPPGWPSAPPSASRAPPAAHIPASARLAECVFCVAVCSTAWAQSGAALAPTSRSCTRTHR